MTFLTWWFVDVPVWGWQHIAPLGHSPGGLVLFVLAAAAYAAVTLAVAGFGFLGVAALVKAFGRGVRCGLKDSSADGG